MRKFLDALFSFPALTLLAGAGASGFGIAATGDPLLAAGVAGFLTGWIAFLWASLAPPASGRATRRSQQAAEYRAAVDLAVPPKMVPQTALRDHLTRRDQLDRIFALETHIARAGADSPGGISVATPAVLLEVRELADQAIELGMRRIGLLRALRSTSEARLVWEQTAIRARLGQVGPGARDDLEALLQAKAEQLDAYRRLGDELTVTEAQLDSIETFLHTLSYDQTVTVTNVNDQIGRLKGQIAARREAAEDVRRLVADPVAAARNSQSATTGRAPFPSTPEPPVATPEPAAHQARGGR